MKEWLRSRIKWFGPGLITAALVFGPGSLTITSSLGASFGYALLWIIPISAFFMATFVYMSIRVGLSANESLLIIIRNKWGYPVSVFIGVSIFLVTASFQAGNSVGAGLAFSELTGTGVTPWIALFALVSISLLYFQSFYKILERMMLVLVFTMLISFIGTILIIQPSLADVVSGLKPGFPDGSLLLSIALVASSFSVVGAFYQSYLVQEKKWRPEQHAQAITEGITGITILGLIGGIILICAAAVLHPLGMAVTSAADMGQAIEPLFGRFAKTLFMVGLFGASFSSLIGNATLGGTLLSDALGFGSRLELRKTRVFIMILMLLGALIAIIFREIPIDLIIFAQAITIFIVPFIGIVLFVTAHSPDVTANPVTSRWSKFWGIVGILLLFALSFRNVHLIFF
jgi:manganese transport protein